MLARLSPLETIPLYKPLESLAKEQKDDVAAVLLADTVEVAPGKQFMDRQFELEYPDAIAFTDIFTGILTDNTPEARAVTYRAFHAAYTIAALLRGEIRPAFIPSQYLDYVAEASDDETNVRRLVEDKAEFYLRKRPALDDLVGMCMTEITHSGNYLKPAETMAATTLMIVDKSERSAHAQLIHQKFPQN
jgi:hypothetical protein